MNDVKTKLDFSAYERRYGESQPMSKIATKVMVGIQNRMAAKSELPDDEPPRAA